MTMTETETPHVAEKIEPGAILYSSWGYDQTNIDYYMVKRVTKSSAWIVPMTQNETPRAGYSPMSGFTIPLEPLEFSQWCKCDHRVSNHDDGELNPTAERAPVTFFTLIEAGKPSTTALPFGHFGTTGLPNISVSRVDLPEPEGPTTSPICQGFSSSGRSTSQASSARLVGGTSNIPSS